jgi:hypothetical protein
MKNLNVEHKKQEANIAAREVEVQTQGSLVEKLQRDFPPKRMNFKKQRSKLLLLCMHFHRNSDGALQ